MSEKLCLQWNDFKANVNSAFGRLRDDKEFTDVTLACEDGQQMEAHKVILAASSPFFEKILQTSPSTDLSREICWPSLTSSTLVKQMFTKRTWIPFLKLLQNWN